MVRNRKIKAYFENIKELIGFDSIIYVIQEEHLKKKLNGASGTFLAVVLPSAQTEGKADNTSDVNTILLLILQNFNKSDETDSSEFDQFDYLQGLALEIKDKIISDADSSVDPMALLDRSSIEIDPEYNVAGGYNGYSITFNFNDYVI